MNKQILLKFFFISCLVFLTSCWDQAAVDEKAYVVAIGLDKGEDDHIRVSFLIENPTLSTLSQGGTQNEPSRKIISFVAEDYIAAKEIANVIIPHEITYDILKYMFIAEEFARENKFIRYMYDAAKDMEIRRDLHLIVTKENAFTFLEQNNPKFEKRPYRYYDLMLKRGFFSGMIPIDSMLLYYYRITEANADLFLSVFSSATPEEDKQIVHNDQFMAGELASEGTVDKTQFAGSAVFKEGKMIGKLTAEETRLTTLLNKTLRGENILTNLTDPFNEAYEIALRIISNRNNEINMDLKQRTIDVTVPLIVNVLTNHSMTDYWDNQDNRRILKEHIEEELESKFKALVKKTQEEFKAQPFGWSLEVRKKFLTIREYEQFDWKENYPDMEVNITVDVRFGEFGRQRLVPDLKEIRD